MADAGVARLIAWRRMVGHRQAFVPMLRRGSVRVHVWMCGHRVTRRPRRGDGVAADERAGHVARQGRRRRGEERKKRDHEQRGLRDAPPLPGAKHVYGLLRFRPWRRSRSRMAVTETARGSPTKSV